MSGEFSGLLRERVIIERPVDERSPQGTRVAGWVEAGRCLAAVTAEGAGSESEAMALSAMPRFRVMLRPLPHLAIDHRLLWRGRVLAIRQVIDDPRLPDRQILRCEEVRA